MLKVWLFPAEKEESGDQTRSQERQFGSAGLSQGFHSDDHDVDDDDDVDDDADGDGNGDDNYDFDYVYEGEDLGGFRISKEMFVTVIFLLKCRRVWSFKSRKPFIFIYSCVLFVFACLKPFKDTISVSHDLHFCKSCYE